MGVSNAFFFPKRVCRIYSRGEAVSEEEEVTEEAATAPVTDAGDAVTVFVAPGLSDDSICNPEDEAGAPGASGGGGGRGRDPGGVVLTAAFPGRSGYLRGFFSGSRAAGILGWTASISSCV